MKPYLAYIRVSTARQGDGSSLAEQRASIEAYARRHDLHVADWIEERETAAKGGRRAFSALLTKLRTLRFAGVIIHKIDRGARNLRDWARLGELVDSGVHVLFTHESLDLTSRGGRLAADIQAVVAADYVRNLRDEVLKGFYGRLKQGFYPLKAPLGYLDHGAAQHKTIDPQTGPLVRLAFEAYATGQHTYESLAAMLYARGLRGATGKPVSINVFHKMLRNPFYYGVILIRNRGEWFEGGHEPLISKALFDAVEQVRTGRTMIWETAREHAYRKLIRCLACGRFLVGEFQKGRAYYRCHKKGCGQPALREDRIEATLLDVLDRLRLETGELIDLRACAAAHERQARHDRTERIRSAQQELAQTDARIARLTDAYLDGVLEKELFLARKAALLDQRAELKSAADGQPDPTSVQEVAVLQLADQAREKLPTASASEKRDLMTAIAQELTAIEGRLQIRLKPPLDRIAEQAAPAAEGTDVLTRDEAIDRAGSAPDRMAA